MHGRKYVKSVLVYVYLMLTFYFIFLRLVDLIFNSKYSPHKHNTKNFYFGLVFSTTYFGYTYWPKHVAENKREKYRVYGFAFMWRVFASD